MYRCVTREMFLVFLYRNIAWFSHTAPVSTSPSKFEKSPHKLNRSWCVCISGSTPWQLMAGSTSSKWFVYLPILIFIIGKRKRQLVRALLFKRYQKLPCCCFFLQAPGAFQLSVPFLRPSTYRRTMPVCLFRHPFYWPGLVKAQQFTTEAEWLANHGMGAALVSVKY